MLRGRARCQARPGLVEVPTHERPESGTPRTTHSVSSPQLPGYRQEAGRALRVRWCGACQERPRPSGVPGCRSRSPRAPARGGRPPAPPRLLVGRPPAPAPRPPPGLVALLAGLGHVRQERARSLLVGERGIFAFGPTNRNVANLIRNLSLAWQAIRHHRPRVVTTGAGVAVPFAWIARLRGARVIYVESLSGSTPCR